MYTKEQLHGMSDFEVNLALAKLTKSDHLTVNKNPIFRDSVDITNDRGDVLKTIDYTHVYNDIMPLAFNEIGLIQLTAVGWHVESKSFDVWCFSFLDASPLRAIACCLILVLQDKE